MWILRDLSNGDGADRRPWPTYIWSYRTRNEARERGRLHRVNRQWSRLGPVEYRVTEDGYRRQLTAIERHLLSRAALGSSVSSPDPVAPADRRSA